MKKLHIRRYYFRHSGLWVWGVFPSRSSKKPVLASNVLPNLLRSYAFQKLIHRRSRR
jgi:hypothetical protein